MYGFHFADIISIHAPAKGATTIPTDTCGSTLFQSTLPRRERLPCVQLGDERKDFNPRSREGSDGMGFSNK